MVKKSLFLICLPKGLARSGAGFIKIFWLIICTGSRIILKKGGIHRTQYTVQSTQYTVHSTQYTVHITLHTFFFIWLNKYTSITD